MADVERKLLAIFAADVEGYSRLMGADEAGTLKCLTERRAILDNMIASHRGRIANTAGDSVLAAFGSAVDAVQCAVEAQVALTEANAGLPSERRINFRIGIHVGDVMVKEGDLFGDGVNIAARLQSLASAGGCCISNVAYDQVKKILPLGFADLGAQQVKNIEEPIRAYAVTSNGAAAHLESFAASSSSIPLPLPDKPSIAVLPFENMSGDREQDYFADGVVEEIITSLSRIKWLFVIARSSSFTYKSKAVDVKRVGHELGVRYLLRGSVRKSGDRVRISAQLIEAQNGVQIWAERYDRRLDDIFALEDDITLSVIGSIEPRLRDAEIERVRRKRPDSLDAYDLVLRAIPHTYPATPEECAKALPLLEQALALDPENVSAHGWLAWCHEVLFVWAGFNDENRAAAIRHAHAAVAEGRDDATALALAAFAITMVEHDRRAGREAFESALALSPSSALALFLGCIALAYGGEAALAIDWAARALRLSPVDRLAYAAPHATAIAHFSLRQYEQAAAAAERAVQANPHFSIAHCVLSAALARLGRLPEAKAVARQVLVLQPSFSASRICAALGIQSELAKAFTEAWREAGLPP